MPQIVLIFLLILPATWGQQPISSNSLTNKPFDYFNTILDPQKAVHDSGIGAVAPPVVPPAFNPARLPEIPSATNPAPPRLRSAPYNTNSPFRVTTGATPPSAQDLAGKWFEITPPKLSEPAATKPILPAPTPAEPATSTGGKFRYVATIGNDNNAGTQDSPWKTLQHAAALAQPGDVVTVRPGTYEAFHTVRGGEAKRPITFRAEPDVIIVPQGGQAPVGLQASLMKDLYRLDNIHVRNTDFIIIEGFQVQRAGRAGISVIEARGVIIRQNVVGPNGRWGIFTGFAPEVQIISNKTFGSGIEHGIYVSNSRVTNDNPVVRYNETYDNHGNGIQFNGDCNAGGDGSITGALIEGNLVHDNDLKGLSLISMSDSVVQNNLIYNNGKSAGAGGIHLTDELGCDRASSGNVIVNNTVVEPRIACIRITDGAKNNIIFNNLLVGNRPLVDEVNNNQIDLDSNVRLDSVIGVFNNSEFGDFHPLGTSPAKNTGVGSYREKRAPLLDREGNRRRAALGFDAGAY